MEKNGSYASMFGVQSKYYQGVKIDSAAHT